MNTQQGAALAPAIESEADRSERHAWYLVFTLLIFYIFSFIDRQIISLMVGPLKRDMGVNDTFIGLLQGPTFAIFYTLCGIPIGRLADRINRKKVIAVGVVIWSLMATLCGLARNFWQLFAVRIGVGVGEAALSPAAYSMITDAFPRHKLGRAFSVYNMGIAIGSGTALLVGGLIAVAVSGVGKTFTLPLLGEVRGWQFLFIVTGAPGLLLPLLLLTVREPARRGMMRTADNTVPDRLPLKEVLAFMGKNGLFYRPHFLAMAMMACLGYAVGAWLPEVMARTYSIEPGRVGAILGTSTIVINTLGIFTAGRICDRLTARGHTDAPIWVCFGTAVAVVVTSALPAFMPTAILGLTMMCIAGFPFHGYVAMGPMAVNQVTPNQMRAQVSSVYLFTVNLLGLGLGPYLVPFISDYILRDPSQIRWALLIVVATSGSIAAILLWRVRPIYRQQVAQTAHWQ
ncbi:MAG TPA: MFS transporter [Steroidobacteraceae bacterium]|nr:MFS transporter [Steroidobacteraceae bacterium]